MKPTNRALRQAAAFWSSHGTGKPTTEPRPSEICGIIGWCLDGGWQAHQERQSYFQDATDAASAALSDACAPRGMR
jgi:hypothetical protein